MLSDSIDNGAGALAAAMASGDIDGTNLFVLSGQAGTGAGEGLAMCEIVHDLAPQASLYFATGIPTNTRMAANILALADAGCRVIIDDVTYADESPFQDGPIARAVDTVSANGVLYFATAGNSGNLDSGFSATWEGDYVDSGYGDNTGEWHAFAPGVDENPIGNGGYDFSADLFWSDPLGASANDYDLYMLDGSGDVIYYSNNYQGGAQDPYEHINESQSLSAGYYLVVVLYNGAGRFLHLDFGRGRLVYATAGCLRGHNTCAAANAFSVAATPAAGSETTGYPTGPYPNPFDASNVVEPFTADGPRQIFFNPDGSAITPGNFSSTGGLVLMKPEFSAADGVTTTLPLNGGLNPFFGTSAAAPHAGAIAALVLSCNPTLTPAQVRTVLTNSCIDIMAAGWDRDSGWGILMAQAALQNTPPLLSPSFVSGSLAGLPGGGFQATLAGMAGASYQILVSSDLQTWSPFSTLSMTNTNSVFIDATAGLDRRFYRAQLMQ